MAQERKRRRFTAEYKAEAVKRLEESGKALQQVAAELGVHANQLRTWRNERLAAGSAEALARQKAEAAELAGLKRENKRLEQEDEILERAAAFFAREAVPTWGTASSPPSARPCRCGGCAGSWASRRAASTPGCAAGPAPPRARVPASPDGSPRSSRGTGGPTAAPASTPSCARTASGSAAGGWRGSCAEAACRPRAGAASRARPTAGMTIPWRRTCSAGTSPPTGRTRSGSRTSARYCRRIQAAWPRAAKRVTRVLARVAPASQLTARETFIAAPVQACCSPVLARPM